MKTRKKDSNLYRKITPFQRTKELKPQLWKVFSKYVRLRDKMTCYTCGKKALQLKDCHAGHFIAKGTTGVLLYFDERNVHCQCVSCNSFKSGNLAIYALRLEQDYGYGILQKLEALKNQVFKADVAWYEEKIEYYTKKVEELEQQFKGKKEDGKS